MIENYKEQLKDPRWIEKRKEIMERDHYLCQCCGSKMNLNVHHTYYDFNKKAWEYNDKDLITLCEECHRNFHEKQNTSKMNVNIGDVYTYDHSDYTNYYIVYDIDYLHKRIFMFGYDNGSGIDDIWFDNFSFNDLKTKCRIYHHLFDDMTVSYIANILISEFDLLKKYREHNTYDNVFTNEIGCEKEKVASAILNIPIILNNINNHERWRFYNNTCTNDF